MKIKDIAKKISSGGTPTTQEASYYNGGNIPWLRTQEVNFNFIDDTEIKITEEGLRKSSAKWVERDSIIVAMYGNSAGRVAYNNIPLTTNQACCNITVDSTKADSRYLYYYLTTQYNNLKRLANGGAQQNLNVEMIKNFKFTNIPLPEQKRISSILSSFDNKIEQLKKENNILEDIAQNIFKEWFVKYNFPNKDGKPYKDNNGKMIDSELGEIPEGWKVLTLGKAYKLIAGGDKPKHFSENKITGLDIPVYSNGIKNDGLYGYTDEPQISIESVTVSARGTIGFVRLRTKPYFPIVRLIAVIPQNANLTSNYAYHYLINRNIQGSGTTQQQLTIPAFSTMKIPVPEDTIGNNFTKFSDSIYIRIEQNRNQVQNLSSIKDNLITKLISIA